jgi:hypothetical protein
MSNLKIDCLNKYGIKPPIVVLLTMWQVGALVMELNGKSR